MIKQTSDGIVFLIASTNIKLNMQMRDTRRDVIISYFDRW